MVKIFSLIKPIFFALFVLVFLIEPIKSEEDSWVVSDIRISGLQRVFCWKRLCRNANCYW